MPEILYCTLEFDSIVYRETCILLGVVAVVRMGAKNFPLQCYSLQ